MKINGNDDGGGRTPVVQAISIISNGIYTPPTGVDGYNNVNVDVPQSCTGYSLNDVLSGNLNISTINSPVTEIKTTGALYPDVTEVNLPNCTSIGSYAFDNCQQLSTVSLPNCISISSSAFAICLSLTSIYLPECTSIYYGAFDNCQQLSTVSLPKVSWIEGACFAQCFSIQSINLPECSFLGGYAFQNCQQLSTVSLPKVKELTYGTFMNCYSLASVNLPECTRIDGQCFYYCSSLSIASLPNCSYLGDTAFAECSSLSTLVLNQNNYFIPDYFNALLNTPFTSGVGSIYVDQTMYSQWIEKEGWSQFSSLFISSGTSEPMLSFSDGTVTGKTNMINNQYLDYLGITQDQITEINLPKLKYIVDWYTFQNLFSLTTVSLPECVSVPGYTFMQCFSLTTVSLPKCTTIYDGAFMYCYSLASVNLPECTNIYTYAFHDCQSLTTVSIPKVSWINMYAFQYCYSLQSIDLPVCSYISNYAFTDCSSLSIITLGFSEVCNMDWNNFDFFFTDPDNFYIYVPASLVDSYKVATNWAVYESRIFSIPE